MGRDDGPGTRSLTTDRKPGTAALLRAVERRQEAGNWQLCGPETLGCYDGARAGDAQCDTGDISSVAISPDNRIIATTSFDGSAKFWRTATEQDVLRQSSSLDLREKLGQSDTKEALQLRKDREVYFSRRVDQRPNDPLAWFDRGRFFDSGGDWKRAADDYQRAVKIGLNNMGYLEEIVQFFETHGARDQVGGAVANTEGSEQPRLEPLNEAEWDAGYLDVAVRFLQSKDRSKSAEEIVRRFISRIEPLRSVIPAKVDHREVLSRVHHELANSFRELKRREDSEKQYHQAFVHYDALVAAFPTNPEYLRERVGCHRDLALMFQSAGRPADAEQEYRQAALEEKLVTDAPRIPIAAGIWPIPISDWAFFCMRTDGRARRKTSIVGPSAFLKN